jgi:putative phosphoesterase
MSSAVGLVKPDAVLHLGDYYGDACELFRMFPDLKFHMIKGNCDFQEGVDDELLLTYENVKIYMAHGHQFGVKNGLEKFIGKARRKGAGLALFGHTHSPLIREARGLWVMNPGQTERHDKNSAASYGVVTLSGGTFDCEIRECGR